MFVSKSRYAKLESEYGSLMVAYANLTKKYHTILDEWNGLVDEINKKGGRDFLDAPRQTVQFSDDDIKRLLVLCHPDKHDGKQVAQDMTAKLLKIRKP